MTSALRSYLYSQGNRPKESGVNDYYISTFANSSEPTQIKATEVIYKSGDIVPSDADFSVGIERLTIRTSNIPFAILEMADRQKPDATNLEMMMSYRSVNASYCMVFTPDQSQTPMPDTSTGRIDNISDLYNTDAYYVRSINHFMDMLCALSEKVGKDFGALCNSVGELPPSYTHPWYTPYSEGPPVVPLVYTVHSSKGEHPMFVYDFSTQTIKLYVKGFYYDEATVSIGEFGPIELWINSALRLYLPGFPYYSAPKVYDGKTWYRIMFKATGSMYESVWDISPFYKTYKMTVLGQPIATGDGRLLVVRQDGPHIDAFNPVTSIRVKCQGIIPQSIIPEDKPWPFFTDGDPGVPEGHIKEKPEILLASIPISSLSQSSYGTSVVSYNPMNIVWNDVCHGVRFNTLSISYYWVDKWNNEHPILLSASDSTSLVLHFVKR